MRACYIAEIIVSAQDNVIQKYRKRIRLKNGIQFLLYENFMI